MLGLPLLAFLSLPVLAEQPAVTVDIAGLDPLQGEMLRVHGSSGDGSFGTPVAAGQDVDGDGLPDYAVSFMRASPLGRANAGEIKLVFGNGEISGVIDSAVVQPRVLRIAGDVTNEAAGSEIWIDDVTGDGLADLLICRQNFSPDTSRRGAGALSIIVGGPSLRTFAGRQQYLDLRAPDPSLNILTLVGANQFDRLGIWVRTGDVDGDGTADLVIGADQEDSSGESNSGAVYVLRGGPHLAASLQVNVGSPATGILAGNLARLRPPAGSAGFHLGATCFVADLDRNGRGEVLAAAALSRAGAAINPFGAPAGTARATGGAPRGAVFIAWDDNFPAAPWPIGFELDISDSAGSNTVLRGGPTNILFGEEIGGNADFNDDGRADLFVADFFEDGSPSGNRPNSGVGYVFYTAELLRNQNVLVGSEPAGIMVTRILGPSPGAIGGDTAIAADFDGDGLTDLLFGSPHASPLERESAGIMHILFGKDGVWPAVVDTAAGNLPPVDLVRVSEIIGARGSSGPDHGDTLCYSVASGDIDQDGIADVVTNEMLGNGLAPNTLDVGNLVILSGTTVSSTSILYFAQFGNGQGFSSEIVLTNTSATLTASGQALLSDDEGSALEVGLRQGQNGASVPGSSVDFQIPPLGSITITTDGMGDLVPGAVRVTSNVPISGVIRFNVPGIGVAGVGTSPPLTSFIVPARLQSGINTGLAILNLGPSAVTLELTLRNTAGEVVAGGMSTIVVPGGGHTARFIDELFMNAVLNNFSGTVVCEATGGPIAAIALELGNQAGQFTTLPVSPIN